MGLDMSQFLAFFQISCQKFAGMNMLQYGLKINEIIIENSIELCTYRHGCCVIQKYLETRDVYNFVESEEWTPTKAVVILLSGLVTIGNKKILDRMLKYISECFNNNLVIRFDSNIKFILI